MKKAIALILALLMVLALAACAQENADGSEPPKTNASEPPKTEASEPPETDPPAARLTDEELVARITAICDGKTGEMPVENTSFAALKEAGFETEGLWANWFNGMAIPEGADIAVNQPIMGQAHVVLLIQPAVGASAEELKAELDKNANPNWMICMTADSVASAVKDGLVLFVMTSKEELGLDAQSFIDAFNA